MHLGGGLYLAESSKAYRQTDWNQQNCSLFMEVSSKRFVRRGVLLLIILSDVINLIIPISPDYSLIDYHTEIFFKRELKVALS